MIVDPSTQNLGTYKQLDQASAKSSEWSNTRTWCFHTPLFFFVGGFLLASGTSASISDKNGLRNFYKVRILSLHPMYLISVLLCTVIFIAQCNPRNYIPEFDRTRLPLEGENFVCQATPTEMKWTSTLLTSVIMYSLLLQSWRIATPFTWFLSYYTWFTSVYIFCILVFPWCHKPFFAARNDRNTLYRLTISWIFALYIFIGAFSFGLTLMNDEATLNW